LNEWSQSLERAAAEDAKGHFEAVAVLEAYWRLGKPFALFLRNFASEALDVAAEMGTEFPFRGSIIFPGYSEAVEERVLAAIGPGVPLISISNPSPKLTLPERIPKLEVNNDIWQSALRVLVDAAGIIILLLGHMSPGVLEEVNMILERGRAESTVLIVSPQVEEQVPLLAELKKAQLAGGTPPEDLSGIPRFALVLGSADLPEKPSTQIRELIERLGPAAPQS
jgi:hypothetical protein